MAWERGPMTDEHKQKIKDGWARRKAGAPTKKERRAGTKAKNAASPVLSPLGHVRKIHSVHRYSGDGSGYRTFAEIGAVCNVSNNAVNVIYLRAVRKIAEEILRLQTARGLAVDAAAVEALIILPAFEEMVADLLDEKASRVSN
jgi:hypothetical protein